jgi:hypothetical protein
MSLTQWEILALTNAVADRARLVAMTPRWSTDWSQRFALSAERQAIADARNGVIAIDWPGWLKRTPSDSDRTQGCRAIRRLAARGLIVPHGLERIKFLELTADGEAVARAILKDGAA